MIVPYVLDMVEFFFFSQTFVEDSMLFVIWTTIYKFYHLV